MFVTVTVPRAGWVKLTTLMAKAFGSISFASTPVAATFSVVSSKTLPESLTAVGSSSTRTMAVAGTLSAVFAVVSITVAWL